MADSQDALPRESKRGAPAMRWARRVFFVAAIALLGWALASQWQPFVAALEGARPSPIVGAFALALVALPLNAMSWRAAMAAVGVRMRIPDAMRVFFVSQVGKYVPGSVWPVLAQMQAAKDRGESRAVAAAGSILAMMVGAVVVGIVGLGALARPALNSYAWLAVFPLVGALVLAPPVCRRLLGLVFALTKRREPVPPVAGKKVIAAAAWSVAVWAALGGQAWLVLSALAPNSGMAPVEVIGIFAVAWLVGFVVVVAPAGAGAREAVLVAALAGAVTAPTALAVSLVSRIAMTVADGVGALVALASRPKTQHH